ncbi:hypothetical protein [Eubacterium aggregans]|uniref:hypothetical protein n=1 Tax=Eubacterium aggregans TaxID=81409 RepID=UPI003F662CA4
MMNNDINLNDECLYIPSGVKSQKEVFEGYPVANCIKVGISWIVLGAVMFLLFLVNTRNPGFSILGMYWRDCTIPHDF